VKTLLAETTDFLRLYLHHAGRSQVPVPFHVWTALGLLAGAVADRIGIRKFAGKPLAPNLYVMLLGPSGCGKGAAIDVAAGLAAEVPAINLYAGQLTAAHLIDILGGPSTGSDGQVLLDGSKVFLVTEELALSVGEGPLAADFIRHMTGLYRGVDYPLRKGTVTRGAVVVRHHCITWVAGTTEEWLVESVPPSAIKGGFLGRFTCVKGDYDFADRRVRPDYPPDAALVRDYLLARLEALTHLEGEFVLDAEARELEAHWYQARPVPEDEALLPTWAREHDLVLKLTQLLAISRGETLVGTKVDFARAQKLAAYGLRAVPDLVTLASATRDTVSLHAVEKIIKDAKEIPHFALLRRVSARGTDAETLKLIIRTLVERQQVAVETRPGIGRRGLVYRWVGSPPPPKEETASPARPRGEHESEEP
jgi:hypothetical protein